MKDILPIIYKAVFVISIVFLCISLWTYTIGQSNNIEFKDNRISSNFYYIIFTWTPIAILLTLFGTVKKSHSGIRKVFTVLTTVLIALCSFVVLLQSIFVVGFGNWITTEIVYQNKENPSKEIKEQVFDIGALGYGDTRTIEAQSFLVFFNKINVVDTTILDKNSWMRINKEGEIKMP